MKITKIEKVALGILAATVLFLVVSVTYTMNAIDAAGGMKAIVIEAGKEIKDIGEQINNED